MKYVYKFILLIFFMSLVGCTPVQPEEDKESTPKYIVTLEYGDKKETIETEGAIDLPTPTKDNHLFIGWFIDDVEFCDNLVKEDLTLVAKWIQYGTKYNIFYDTDGGELPTDWPRKHELGQTTILPIPSKKHHEFLGWYLDEEFTDGPYEEIDALTYGNKLFYAKYKDIAVYKNISYELNGGELLDSIDKYIPGEEYLLNFPKREGYYFKGWYFDADFSTDAVSVLDKTYDSDLMLYAKWEERTLQNATIGIYGDSVSTYFGYIPDNFSYYYPQPTLDVLDVGDTWWYKLYQNNNLNIKINNSISGTGVINYGGMPGFNGLSQKRIDLLIQDNVPVNVVIIYLGINDCKVGTDVTSFKRAYKQMIEAMKSTLGDIDIILCTLPASTFSYVSCYALREEYNKAIKELSEEYDLGLAEIDKAITSDNQDIYMANMLHPNKAGMEIIYIQVMDALDKYIGV